MPTKNTRRPSRRPSRRARTTRRARRELVFDKTRSREDLEEAVKLLEDVHRISRRVLGPAHPHTEGHLGMLKQARFELAYENGKV